MREGHRSKLLAPGPWVIALPVGDHGGVDKRDHVDDPTEHEEPREKCSDEEPERLLELVVVELPRANKHEAQQARCEAVKQGFAIGRSCRRDDRFARGSNDHRERATEDREHDHSQSDVWVHEAVREPVR